MTVEGEACGAEEADLRRHPPPRLRGAKIAEHDVRHLAERHLMAGVRIEREAGAAAGRDQADRSRRELELLSSRQIRLAEAESFVNRRS